MDAYRIHDCSRPFAFTPWEPQGLDHLLEWYLGPELSRKPDRLRQIALCVSRYVGTMHVILTIHPDQHMIGVGEGRCELGTILSSEDYYDYGCDIAALHAVGVRLSWEAAQWLHAAGREQIVASHAKGKVYGDLTPRNIRLNLFHHPTRENPAGYTRGGGDELPPIFAFESHAQPVDACEDLSAFARAIMLITEHPDPSIDALLRDPQSPGVLRDLLLERGGPVEMLLGDASAIELPWLPLPQTYAVKPDDDDFEDGDDAKWIDGELAELWHDVLRLDPLIDTSTPEIFDLPGPWVVSIHGPRPE